uniref:Amino acid transporter n=2 Tax=Meloidogyne TaxID=189290 RepID=A0A914M628_MELIC
MRQNNGENKIGVFEGIAYCIGDIIGSGIFISPTSILRHTGSVGLSLCVWAVGALIAACGALVYVELGTSIGKSGGDFAYLSHAKWHPLATAFLWVSTTLTFPVIMAIQTLTFGEYLVDGLNSFMSINSEYIGILKRLIGFMTIWLVCFMNLFSLKKIAGRFQVVLTIIKLLVIATIIFIGLYQLIFKNKTEETFVNAFEGSKTEPGDFVLALYASLLAYNGNFGFKFLTVKKCKAGDKDKEEMKRSVGGGMGWDILNFATDEVENPRRVLPLAALCGIGISAVVYLLINIAYFSVLTIDEFLNTEAVAFKFAEKTMGDFSRIFPFLIAILLLGNLNSSIFASSRYVFAGAKNGIMPRVLSSVHEKSMSPRVAIIYEMFVLISLSFIGDLEHLIGYMSYSLWMQKSCTMVALLYMRHKGTFKFQKNSIKTPIILPFICLCIFISMLIISARKDPFIIIYALTMLAIGLILYFIFINPKRRSKSVFCGECFEKVNDLSVFFTQIVFNTTVPNKEE